jgi:hypothetical protein
MPSAPRIDIRLSPNWRRLVADETRPEWEKAAKEMAEFAEQTAPRLTGELAGSITGEMVGSGDDIAALAYATAPHAAWVEIGTSDTRAQPYLRPALVKVAKRRFR